MTTPGNGRLKRLTANFVYLALLLCLLLQNVSSSAQQTNDSTIMGKQLDDYMTASVASGKFNGSVLIARKGKIILQKGYGWKNYSRHTLNDINSIFPIGSLTKPFTAMIILKLQEEHKLSVNDRLSKYVPEQMDADKITVQNLLNHSSGIYDFSHDIPENDSALLSHPIPRQKVLDAFLHRLLEFKPGTRYSYCSSDYILLGLIIERITGMSYWQVVRQLILAPLDMDHSGFDFINLRDTAKATGYKILTADKQILAVKWDSTVSYSAGALYSTTGDLYKWAEAIGKRQILSDSSWRHAFTPNLGHYGDGWFIDTLYGRRYIYHSGGLLGFMSDFMYYPDDDVTIIMLNNFGNYGQNLLPVNHALSAIIFNTYTSWKSRKAISLDDAVLQQYTGTYTVNGKDKVFISFKNHQLFAESSSKNGIPSLPIFAENENSFFLKDFDAVFTFVKGADNSVNKFISYENGKVMEFSKIK
jgi:CubicO group peptidase (beta-lactamase class C family)